MRAARRANWPGRRACRTHDLCLENEVRGLEVSEAEELRSLRDDNSRLKRLVELAHEKPCFGYRRLQELIGWEGMWSITSDCSVSIALRD